MFPGRGAGWEASNSEWKKATVAGMEKRETMQEPGFCHAFFLMAWGCLGMTIWFSLDQDLSFVGLYTVACLESKSVMRWVS